MFGLEFGLVLQSYPNNCTSSICALNTCVETVYLLIALVLWYLKG